MIERNKHYLAVEKSVERSPVTAILGPRQCGKTTLARSFGEPHQAHYFDLESVVDQRRLQNPELMLSSLDGVIILDEIQYQPELFNLLRVLVDRPENKSRFVVLGSASPQLI
jgi:predicted AAA+ superfamily ATPase